MEMPDTKQRRREKREAAPDHESASVNASFQVRLWVYAGPGEQLSGLTLERDSEVSGLVRGVIIEGHGQLIRQHPSGLEAHFSQPLYALATAKTLQQRLLALHSPALQQVVAAILIFRERNDAVSAADNARTEVLRAAQVMLDGSHSAQILVSEQIRELAQNEPGFQFSPKPVREAGDGVSEALYELLWTDESTYGHLREAGSSTGIHTAGRYQIQAELGRGAMGVVYKAYDQLIDRTVALKTISIDHNAPNRRELIERLKLEAKAAGGLDHPNIITIFDVGQEDDRVYLSMQFLEGRTLLAMLDEGQLPPLATLVSYAEQICSAVDYAHERGVIHRDLKPANLMLTSQGVIKVLDFGIAKIEDATLTQTGMVVGTPTHMAPEQVADKKIDHRTDIFALGSVFYELFTREKPFRGDITAILYKIIHEDPLPPSIINPALPGGIDAIIRKALAKEPRARYQSCAEMGKAFREQAALLKAATPRHDAAAALAPAPGDRIVASTPSHMPRTATARSRKRIWPALVAVLLLAMGGAAGWAFYIKSHTGSFPPLVRRAVAAVRREIRRPAANGHGNAGSLPPPQQGHGSGQTAQNGEGTDAASGRSADSTVGGSVAANAGEALQTPAAQQNALSGAPTHTPSTGQSPNAAPQSGKSQPAADAAHTSASMLAGNDQEKTLPDKRPAAGAFSQPAAATQSSNLPPQNESGQAAMPNGGAAKLTGSAQDSAKAPTVSADDQKEPATQPEIRIAAKMSAARETVFKVDGFSRRDVPELLRQADAAASRGDYRQARYEYALILKLDRNNAAARTGLRRAQTAEQDRAHR
jgi:eukaryotic-like serine/threonine-protein kinase